MKISLSEDMFISLFEEFQKNRDSENFSRAGLMALYELLEEYEEGTGEEINIDFVALCCEYTEYSSAWEAMQEYQPEDMPTVEDSEGMDLIELQEEEERLAMEWLEENTLARKTFDGGVIIQSF